METFLVRIWLPAEGPDLGAGSLRHLRGFLLRVSSGQQLRFLDGEELLQLLRAEIQSATVSRRLEARGKEE